MVDYEQSDTEGAEQEEGRRKTWREEHSVSGESVISKIKELLHEGNVRHIVIKNEEGRTLIEFPVTVGVAGALLVPVWAAVGAIAAIVSKCSIQVELEE
jgi:hypothetical protein